MYININLINLLEIINLKKKRKNKFCSKKNMLKENITDIFSRGSPNTDR